ncbi:MAG TPA: PorT family protein [Candidatus Alistipes merdigallinarum]|nr:PorT family protein [Candidatus Alistipes merdigallinarum]
MKKTILFIGVMLLAVGVSSAQPRFSFGPKVGVNLSNLYIDAEGVEEADIVGIKPGLLIGAFAEYDFTPAIGVSIDLLYSREGTESNRFDYPSQKGYYYKHKYSLQYLNIPVLVNFYLARGLAVKAGIQPGVLLGAKYRVEWEYGEQDGVENQDIKDNLLPYDISIPIGLSYTFDYGLFIDGRYNLSLCDIMNQSTKQNLELDGVTYHKVKNRSFSFSVGWKF